MYIFQIRKAVLFSLLLLSNNVLAQSSDDEWEDWGNDQTANDSPWIFNSYIQALLGQRLHNNSAVTNTSAKQATWRLEADYEGDIFQLKVKSNARYDGITKQSTLKMRELALTVNFADSDMALIKDTLLANTSLVIGRQSLSWGVGDFLFINDIYAKNWSAFFDGSDIQYLKQPNDALKLSYFADSVSIDFVYQPSTNTDQLVNHESLLLPATPDGSTTNARIYFSHGKADYAVYASDGYSPSPEQVGNEFSYHKLRTLGFSGVMPLYNGLFKFEAGKHWRRGNLTPNKKTQTRFLFGYEQELIPRLNLSLQGYIEHDSTPSTYNHRQVVTAQFNYLSEDSAWQSQLMFFHSPNHYDSYIRYSTNLRYSDAFSLSFGANILTGNEQSFFGRLGQQDNAFVRATYYF